ncbi:TetR/AcrR family transcriptional regulator [Actinocorallia populi]|uniref:TetR/AcrR family transcriptional regulator n=1 Tax=Actinocorallia populi TaxID=2079200 RepID=UPI0018E556C7|nr:TetR/AcrR family transcriptional regulator [Actinocorallia populi]
MATQHAPSRRARQTRTVLQAAALELIAERSLSQVSVSDVTKRADVNRSTFYEHYSDVPELAAEACAAMFDELIAAIPALGSGRAPGGERGARAELAGLFARIGGHAAVYRSLLGPEGGAQVIDHLRRRLTAAVHAGLAGPGDGAGGQGEPGDAGESPHDPVAAAVAGAILGAALDWLGRGCPDTPEQLGAAVWPQLAAAVPSGQPALSDRTARSASASRSAAALRAQLLETSLRLFVAHGYRGTSLQEIATEAGCSKAAVLYHFAGKGAILTELLAPATQAAVGLVERLSGIPDGDGVAEAAVEGVADLALRFRREISLLLSDVPEGAKSLEGERDLRRGEPLVTSLGDLLVNALAGRSARPRDRLRAQMAFGAIILSSAGADDLGLTREEMREELVRGAFQVLGRSRE